MKKNKHFYDNIMKQVGTQLSKMNLDSVLGAIGLQLAKRGRGPLLPTVAAFGAGMAVGAGAALMLAPMSGRDLRGKFGEFLKKLPHWGSKQATDLEASPELPHEDAVEPEPAVVNSVHSAGRTKRTNSDGATA